MRWDEQHTVPRGGRGRALDGRVSVKFSLLQGKKNKIKYMTIVYIYRIGLAGNFQGCKLS